MTHTPEIRHQRLHKQHLLASSSKDPVAVLKSLVAVQAQDYYGAKWDSGNEQLIVAMTQWNKPSLMVGFYDCTCFVQPGTLLRPRMFAGS